MTLDEAIKHCQEVAKEGRAAALEYARSNAYDTANSCKACAQEHEQLALWLTELMAYRATDTECGHWIPCAERMPEEFKWCLVCMSDKCIRFGKWNAQYDEQGVWWVSMPNSGGKLYRTKNVPYWMPLPEPPKDGDVP